jgi:hypothetical protein
LHGLFTSRRTVARNDVTVALAQAQANYDQAVAQLNAQSPNVPKFKSKQDIHRENRHAYRSHP